jgi:hypothetical protein
MVDDPQPRHRLQPGTVGYGWTVVLLTHSPVGVHLRRDGCNRRPTLALAVALGDALVLVR